MARVRGPGRRAAVVLISVLAVAGCGPSGPSELVVHNRTLVPITVRDAAQNFIEPCGSATFRWEDWALRWAPQAGSRPVDPKAVSVDVYAQPIEGLLHAVVIVTEDGSRIYSPGEVPSLPPCSGSPPPVPSLLPSATSTTSSEGRRQVAQKRMKVGEDEVTLVAGDADYVPTVSQLRARGFTFNVVSWEHASRELREAASKFIAMNNYLGYLAVKP